MEFLLSRLSNPVSMMKRTEVEGTEDYINSLCDDTLISMLSLLPVKDAAITSSLSRRWENLWTNISRLCFCGKKFDDRRSEDQLRVDRPIFVDWVNNVIEKYKGQHVEYLQICFDLDNSSKDSIDAWLKFATAKGVEILELDFSHNLQHNYSYYSFPQISLCMSNALGCLKTLSLTFVKLEGESLQCILACCPTLQFFTLHHSGVTASKLKFSGLSLMLKYLDISFCTGIDGIEIFDINLVSFRYHCSDSDVIIRNVPKLEKVYFGFGAFRFGNQHFDKLLCCRHIRSLQLNMLTYLPGLVRSSSMFPDIPEFPELNQLTIIFEVTGDDSLLGFTSLIKAFPKLSSFILELIVEAPSRAIRTIEQPSKHAHPSLKFVEIQGYYRRISDAELAIYFLENASNLQKMVINTHIYPCWSFDKIKDAQQAALRYAKEQLKGKNPPGVQLVIH